MAGIQVKIFQPVADQHFAHLQGFMPKKNFLSLAAVQAENKFFHLLIAVWKTVCGEQAVSSRRKEQFGFFPGNGFSCVIERAKTAAL